jgi:hypothetical protein
MRWLKSPARDRHRGLLHLPEAPEGERDEPARREGAREDRDERENRVDADEVRDRLIHGRQRQGEQLDVVLACPGICRMSTAAWKVVLPSAE